MDSLLSHRDRAACWPRHRARARASASAPRATVHPCLRRSTSGCFLCSNGGIARAPHAQDHFSGESCAVGQPISAPRPRSSFSWHSVACLPYVGCVLCLTAFRRRSPSSGGPYSHKSTYRVKSCTVRWSRRALLAQYHFSYGMRGKRACDPSLLGTHGNGAEPAPRFLTASMSLPRGLCAHSPAKKEYSARRVRTREEGRCARRAARQQMASCVCVDGVGQTLAGVG